MRLWIILCCLAIVYPAVGHAEPIQPYIQSLPTGDINWTTSTLSARGSCGPSDAPNSGEKNGTPSDQARWAYRQATENLLHTIQQVRINTDRCVMDAMAADERVSDKIAQMCRSANQTRADHLPDGTLVVSVEMNLLGSFMQLMLPEDVRQVEPIKQMNESVEMPTATPDETNRPESRESGYSGLVVDARGIGAQPSMVPIIVDESGRQVYGSIFISREYAVQYGVCTYVRDIKAAEEQARLAPRPLWVKGLRTVAGHQSDIVISNADAAKLRDASANLNFLKQCRVLVILD